MSAEARAYKHNVRLLALDAGFIPYQGDVSVSVSIYRPRKRGDTDNTLKVLLDALSGMAYADDSQVTEIHAFRFDDKANPRVEVRIEPNDRIDPMNDAGEVTPDHRGRG